MLENHGNKYLKVTEENLIKTTFSRGVHSVAGRCGDFIYILFYPPNNLVR